MFDELLLFPSGLLERESECLHDVCGCVYEAVKCSRRGRRIPNRLAIVEDPLQLLCEQ